MIIAVEIKANQEPNGCRGALYGSESREMPRAFRAFIKRLKVNLLQSPRRNNLIKRLHMCVTDTHPCDSTESRNQVDEPTEHCSTRGQGEVAHQKETVSPHLSGWMTARPRRPGNRRPCRKEVLATARPSGSLCGRCGVPSPRSQVHRGYASRYRGRNWQRSARRREWPH